MGTFAVPEWGSKKTKDKTHRKEVSKKIPSPAKTIGKKPKTKKSKIKTGRVEKPQAKKRLKKLKTNLQNTKNSEFGPQTKWKKSKPVNKNPNQNIRNAQAESSKGPKGKPKFKKSKPEHVLAKKQKKSAENALSEPSAELNEPKVVKRKTPITHQTLFAQTTRKFRPKPAVDSDEISKSKRRRLKKKLQATGQISNPQSLIQTSESEERKSKKTYKEKLKFSLEKNKQTTSTTHLTRKQRAALPLRERMLEKLQGARFRYLNEQMYTRIGRDSKKYFDSDPDAYQAYHEGYKQQVARWPLNPLDVIIEKVKKLPRTHIIADFGCGEAKLAESVSQKVHSFDLVAVNDSVTACDMAHVPLENNTVNVVIFCLSLMGTNLKEYLLEASRVLKVGGLLKIAEVESRFENIDDFIKNVRSFGFVKIGKDFSRDMFCFLDFVKKEANFKQKKRLPDISLNPCLYKRR